MIISRLVWIYAICKTLLLSPVAVKELNYFYHLFLSEKNQVKSFSAFTV